MHRYRGEMNHQSTGCALRVGVGVLLRSWRVVVFAGWTGAALAGCGDPGSPYADRQFCSAGLRLLVSGAAEAPTFTWSETCRVWSLRVSTADGEVVMWEVGKDDESLDSPLTYGQVPPGAAERGPAPPPLVAGATYRALLVQRSNGGRIIADVPFTSFTVAPPPASHVRSRDLVVSPAYSGPGLGIVPGARATFGPES